MADCRQIHTTKASKRSPNKYEIGGDQSDIRAGFLRAFVSPSSIIPPCSLFILLSFFIWHKSPLWTKASSFTSFLDQTQWRTTIGRTPLDEWSVRRRVFYLTTHNTYKTDRAPFPRWDSKPKFEQASGRRSAPQTARLPGPSFCRFGWCNVPIKGRSIKGLSPAAPQ